MRTHFTTAQVPLGFSLELVDFKREMNPGKIGNAAYSSVVRVKDKERQLDDERLISMNQPLSHHGFRFYQSSFREAGHGKEASIFSVAYDPGRPLKYSRQPDGTVSASRQCSTCGRTSLSVSRVRRSTASGPRSFRTRPA